MTDLYTRILQAHHAIRPQVAVSPLERSRALSDRLGCDVWLKNDHLQITGSFKLRGATNRVRALTAEETHAGVLTASTGNHGKALAYAGGLAKAPVRVYVSHATTPDKIDAMRALGAEVVVIDGSHVQAELTARHMAQTEGRTYVSPYNDIHVMAGQGTLGVELMEQAPDLDAVLIAVGGGGLIGGAGTAIKALSPRTRVVGVWAENAPSMLRCLQAGKIVSVDEAPTLSDGTAGEVEPGSITFPICQGVIDETIVVNEAQIAEGMRMIAAAEQWWVEGSAGATLAGLAKAAAAYRGQKVAVVLCGRNIGLDDYLRAAA